MSHYQPIAYVVILSPKIQTMTFSASGGTVTGGSVVMERLVDFLPSHGSVSGGEVSFNRIASLVTDGGTIVGGIAGKNAIFTYPATGGGIAGGSIDLLRLVDFLMSSGGITGGESNVVKIAHSIALWGAICGGRVTYFIGGPPSSEGYEHIQYLHNVSTRGPEGFGHYDFFVGNAERAILTPPCEDGSEIKFNPNLD